MRISIADLDHIYIACGYTDMRKSIDGLAYIVEQQFKLKPYSNDLFLFCGKRRDRFKALLWDGDGFVLLYKRLDNGRFNWPMSDCAVRDISKRQLEWLLEGLSIDQKNAIQPVNPSRFT